jgi:putative tributyrin esterase
MAGGTGRVKMRSHQTRTVAGIVMTAAVMAIVGACAPTLLSTGVEPRHSDPVAVRWADVPHGRTALLRISSRALQERRSVRVYLPPSYDRPGSATRRYPVIYLLHGWPGGDGNWLGHGRAAVTLDTLIARHRIPEVIAVMPNGNGVGLLGRSLYLNSYDGRFRMADWIVRDVVGWADSALRTRAAPQNRAIVGLSDGGTAALNLCFQHPDVFGACGGESGQYRMKHDVGLRRIVGAEPGARELLAANSPTVYAHRMASRLRQLVIYFDCGRRDPELGHARELHAVLDSLAVPHTYREFPGHHGWGYWKRHLGDALVAVTAKMQ